MLYQQCKCLISFSDSGLNEEKEDNPTLSKADIAKALVEVGTSYHILMNTCDQTIVARQLMRLGARFVSLLSANQSMEYKNEIIMVVSNLISIAT